MIYRTFEDAYYRNRRGTVVTSCSTTSTGGIWTPHVPGSSSGYSFGTKVEIKPSRARVEIEELDSDLMSGVKICPLESAPIPKVDKPAAWPCVFYTTVGENNWIKDDQKQPQPGHFILPIESFIKDENKAKAEEIWIPFTSQDVETCTLTNAYFPKIVPGKKNHKAIQKFAIRLQPPADEKKAHIPYVQFYCNQKWVRHQGAVFKEGDLITLVIRHPKYPLHWPNPPIITVIPTAEQTFVPMLPKQKMVIVTEVKEQTVDFKAHPNSTIRYDGAVDSDFGRQSSYFACTKPTHSSEIIFINAKKKKKDNKKVVIPFVEKEVRCPVILNPLKDAVIHSQNIDGFVIRIWKESYHPITIMAGTPIKGVHTAENAQYIERRFEIEKRRPFFYLTKQDHSWVIQ